jgi:MFS family permease
MIWLLAFLFALLGAGVGYLLGAAIASALAPALGIGSFEGAAGYFAAFLGGPIGAVVGLVAGPLLVLRRGGYRGGALAGGLAFVGGGAVALGVAVLAGLWLFRPLVNPGGPAPQLVFEIRLPPGAAAPSANDSPVELQTSKNRMPATLREGRRDGDRQVITGSVEIYYRTWQRLLVLRMPEKTDVLFELSLGMTPDRIKDFGKWQRADFIARPGDTEARRATDADRYEIRYRTEWAGED